MKAPLIFDGRNLYDPETVANAGIEYHAIGRPQLSQQHENWNNWIRIRWIAPMHAFAKSGADVLGIDLDPKKIETLNEGRSYIKHIPDVASRINLTLAVWKPPPIAHESKSWRLCSFASRRH